MAHYLWVGLGGFLGATARYAFGTWIAGRIATTFPLHTLVINLTGSLAIGVVVELFAGRLDPVGTWWLFLVVGFLGGYTTFSSYTFEAITLLGTGEGLRALWYILGSNGLGLIACFVGIVVARLLSLQRP